METEWAFPVQVVHDLGQANYAGTNVPQGQPSPEQFAESRTGAQDPLMTECPHCGWDLKEPDPIQPETVDKRRYLVAAAGGLPYQKPYRIFGSQITLVVRELKPEEVDEIYKEVWHQRARGRLTTAQEFLELVTRYRVCLQVVSLITPEVNNTFPKDLASWGGQPGEDHPTVLPSILEQMYEKALRTESLLRVVTKAIGHFNRLVAKLEDNWHRPDFWEGTEQVGQ